MSIRERILARRDLDDMRAAKDITGLAVALNAEGAKARVPTFITARAVLTKCPGGPEILSRLESASTDVGVRWALKFLGQEAGLDIGDPGVDPLLDGLCAAGVLTQADVDNLKGMSLQVIKVTQSQVAQEMYNADGTEK